MNILHIGKFYPPEAGGIETATQAIVRGQVSMGHHVEVVCFNTNAGGGQESDNAKIHRLPIDFRIGSQPIGWRYFIQGIRRARKSDAVHIHAPNLLASLLSIFLPKAVNVVVHWHSDIIGKGLLGVIARPVERKMINRANAIIGTSARYVASSPMLRNVGEKVSIVPLGVPPPNSGKFDHKVLPQPILDFLGERKLVLATGRMVPYKGFRYLIDAAIHLDDASAVIIVGDGPCRIDLQRQIVRLGLETRVFLAGRVSDETLAGLFRRARVFCLPSIERSEAFGMVLLEAMSYGVPVVATTVEGSGMSWVNSHNVSGINVPERNSEALSNVLRAILNDDELHQRLVSGALDRYKSNFTIEATNLAIEAVYDRLNQS